LEVTASFYKRKTNNVGWHPPYQQMRRDIKMAEFLIGYPFHLNTIERKNI
jgi:hypothetical protein